MTWEKIPEGKEKEKDTEEIFEVVTTEDFSKLISDTKPDNQEAHRTPTKMHARKTTTTTNKNEKQLYLGIPHSN